MKKYKAWAKAAGIRAVKTMAQTAVAMLPAAATITAVDWKTVAGTAALAGVASLLTSVKGLPELKTENETEKDLDISEENLQTIREGMKGVTSEPGGTAYSYFTDLDITIAGKTGSAQTGVGDEAHAWFAGFAPYENPEIAVIVFIEKGASGGYTASTAKEIIKEYFGMNSEKVTEDKSASSSVESVR